MNHNLPDVSISSSDTKLKRVHRVWMDAVQRDSTILQLCLTQSEKLVIYMNMYLLTTTTKGRSLFSLQAMDKILS